MEQLKKKNKFFTVIFSCYPGGGHMYLGFMKQGVQLMFLFSVIAAISSLGYIFNSLGFLIPILIAYSIFDAMHKRNSMAEPNDSDLALFGWFNINNNGKVKSVDYYKVGVYTLIIVGVYILIDNVGLSLLREVLYRNFGSDHMGSIHKIERWIRSGVLGIIFIIGGVKLREKLNRVSQDEQISDEEL